MSHHLSNSLSASAASALHVLGGHVRAFAPSPRVVLGVAALASVGVLGIAGVGVASSHTTVMLEVNGVSRPVTAWGNTVADALKVANVSVGSGDLVQPGVAETVREGDTIVVRTSKAYTVTVDGEPRTLWTTAASADSILADAAPLGTTVTLAADRSASRDELTPLVSRARNVIVNADGTTREVAVRPGQDARGILEAAGVSVHALDRVTVENDATGELAITVSRVTRGQATETVDIPFSETTTTSSDMFVGESQVTTTGVNGVTTWTVWQEKDGDQVLTSVPITEHSTSQPVTQVRSEGTKEATPTALVAAGIDPKATLEEKTESDGTTSVRYRAKLGSISTKEEIAEITGEAKNADQATAAAAAAAAAEAGAVPTTYSGEDPRSLAKPLVAAQGWSDSEYQCLVLLWNRESQWNPYAENSSSGAYGIPQALPGSKMASAGADWRTNPITQINWGIGYIKGRYGTPCSAWAHSNAVGWY
ncbi:ubiquitin-like domain-containing protein [Pauljensenia sp. 20925_1_34]|uniref:aggregation-promoting factor C-terminal-like domain-containing protein n=1 Tax=Pauljensenia sp. 20925_1_34 TaxID=3003674 RepID=UPI0025D529D2|nr:ubiquitin-like domain-containing protein [uncultured Actinomyces sp.]